MDGTPNSNAHKKAVHVKWSGKTIALGTFPAEEAIEKCAQAKSLTRAWRSTMRPKPTREWVMEELERLQVRVVTGRHNRVKEDAMADEAQDEGEYLKVSSYDDGRKMNDSDVSMIHTLPTGQDQSAHLSRNHTKPSHLMRRGSITESLLSVAGAERNLNRDNGVSGNPSSQRGPGGFRDSIGWATLVGGQDPVMDSHYPRRNSSMSLVQSMLLQDGTGGYDPRVSNFGSGIGGFDPYYQSEQRNHSFLGGGGSTTYASTQPAGNTAIVNQSSIAGQSKPSVSTIDGIKPSMTDNTQFSTSPPIAPPHRPLVGGGSAAAYEAAREAHYFDLAEQKKKEATSSATSTNSNERLSSSNVGISAGLPPARSPLYGSAKSGASIPPNDNNLSGLSASAFQHYEMLKLHHMNLLNEIRETSMMINLYEQQQSQLQPGFSGAGNHGKNFDNHTPQLQPDPMEQLLTQKRLQQTDSGNSNLNQMNMHVGNNNSQQYETLRRLSNNYNFDNSNNPMRRPSDASIALDNRRVSDFSQGYGVYNPNGGYSSYNMLNTGSNDNLNNSNEPPQQQQKKRGNEKSANDDKTKKQRMIKLEDEDENKAVNQEKQPKSDGVNVSEIREAQQV